MEKGFIVKAPATTSNMGPGFDCLGMAMTLYNQSEFRFEEKGLKISGEGFNNYKDNDPKKNLIYTSFEACCRRNGTLPPENLQIHSINRIPMGSGMGSSATAILMGIFGANEWGHFGMSRYDLLGLATEIEGHPDNAAPSIFGGFAASVVENGKTTCRRWETADWNLCVVVPHFDLSTHEARKALPTQVTRQDAIFNISHLPFVLEALRTGDESLLRQGMQDRIHEKYRMALLPGSAEAVQAAREAGAAASGLSGAGPGVIAYTMGETKSILSAMQEVYRKINLPFESFTLKAAKEGISVETL